MYQRGVIPHNEFVQDKFHDLDLFVIEDGQANAYLTSTLNDVEKFIADKSIEAVVFMLSNRTTNEFLEKWKFNIEYEKEDTNESSSECKYGIKNPYDIQCEMRTVLRQILGILYI